MRISDWSSDVCSSDLFPAVRAAAPRRRRHGPQESLKMPSEGATSPALRRVRAAAAGPHERAYSSAGERLVDIEAVPGSIPGTPTITFNGLSVLFHVPAVHIGRASCRERVCQYV